MGSIFQVRISGCAIELVQLERLELVSWTWLVLCILNSLQANLLFERSVRVCTLVAIGYFSRIAWKLLDHLR